jgi:hypothetical protein
MSVRCRFDKSVNRAGISDDDVLEFTQAISFGLLLSVRQRGAALHPKSGAWLDLGQL